MVLGISSLESRVGPGYFLSQAFEKVAAPLSYAEHVGIKYGEVEDNYCFADSVPGGLLC